MGIDYYTPQRRDVFSIGSTNNARASHLWNNGRLIMYIDNIWKDTQNFDDFVEGLNVVFMTELLCMNHKNRGWALCISNKRSQNNCVFLLGAKEALNSNYALFKFDYDDRQTR